MDVFMTVSMPHNDQSIVLKGLQHLFGCRIGIVAIFWHQTAEQPAGLRNSGHRSQRSAQA